MKKTILIDLDGVLNNYKGDFDINYIPEIKNEAIEFLKELNKKFTVKIFTTREQNIVKKWVRDNKILEYISDITNIKEPAFLIIDDRCLKFDGDFDKTLSDINNFKAWYM